MAILRITDDTTTINFYGDDNYKLIYGSWSPQRAQNKLGGMGGQTPYTDVVETIPILIRGDSAVQVYEKLEVLSDLLEQAEKWGAGYEADAVKIVYQPDGSTLTNPLEAVILGAGGNKILSVPSTFSEINQNGHVLSPIVIRVLRSGEWLGDSETETGTETTTGTPNIVTSTAFTDDLNILSPVDLELKTNQASTSPIADCEAFVLVSNAANKLWVIEAEAYNLGFESTDTALAGSSAGYVARVEATTDTTERRVLSDSTPPFNSNTRRIAVWTVLRNRSPTAVNWTVWGRIWESQLGPGTWGKIEGPKRVIAAGDNNIKAVFLGIFDLSRAMDRFRLIAQNDAVGAATTDALDVDYLCGIELDENAHVFHFPSLDSVAATDVSIMFENRLNTKLTPDVHGDYVGSALDLGAISHDGGGRIFTNGQYVSVAMFGYKNSDTTYFTIVDDNNVEVEFSTSVVRTNAYLIPK